MWTWSGRAMVIGSIAMITTVMLFRFIRSVRLSVVVGNLGVLVETAKAISVSKVLSVVCGLVDEVTFAVVVITVDAIMISMVRLEMSVVMQVVSTSYNAA